jgi:hypothetical protein
MDKRLNLLCIAAALAASGCNASRPAATSADRGGDGRAGPAAGCSAPANLAGRSLTPALREAATRESGARSSRILRPGEMHTMEFMADRLTIEVDAAGKVVAARCG